MQLDVEITDTRWEAVQLFDVSHRAVGAVLKKLDIVPDPVELSILGCDDAEIMSLNTEFRDKPKATNVLSWPSEDIQPPALPSADPDGTVSFGDIAISFDTCAREAEAAGKPLVDHVTHLIVHGTLHLLGYDHINDADADVMEGLETEILGNLGLADPYVEE